MVRAGSGEACQGVGGSRRMVGRIEKGTARFPFFDSNSRQNARPGGSGSIAVEIMANDGYLPAPDI